MDLSRITRALYSLSLIGRKAAPSYYRLLIKRRGLVFLGGAHSYRSRARVSFCRRPVLFYMMSVEPQSGRGIFVEHIP